MGFAGARKNGHNNEVRVRRGSLVFNKMSKCQNVIRLQNSRIFCERGRPERKAVWIGCKNGKEEWGENRLARFTTKDWNFPAKTTVLQSKRKMSLLCCISAHAMSECPQGVA